MILNRLNWIIQPQKPAIAHIQRTDPQANGSNSSAKRTKNSPTHLGDVTRFKVCPREP
ncbi:hypothetical protein [Poriferisphaera corsica]|uniref:hypothetical protein n=1 Tax=Poriferisphaera corsica TaxID=2528020 RepID=UPI001909622C|nr:hypothetical protein [Poriferisphaera corsica]